MVYHICNIMTCGGLGTEILSGCSMAWIGLVIIFFLIAFARRYLGEEAGVPFSFIGALIGGFGGYIAVITFTCSYKLALVGGLAGVVVLGVVLSSVFDGIGGG
jgi:hypothetical protein